VIQPAPRTGLLDRVEGSLALSTAPTAPGVVVLDAPDGLAEALADAGVHALSSGDVEAGAATLRGHGAAAVYVLGFGAAGTAALRAAAQEGMAGAISFAGPPPLDEAGFVAPVLAFYGGADASIPDADIRAFYDALNAQRVLEETVVYDGAPADFFTRPDDFPDACADAWHRLLRFVGVPAS
jgi:carboxymethylenebutenolidase